VKHDPEVERVAAEVEEFHRRNRDHLAADDVRYGMLVSFVDPRGDRRIGKVAKWGPKGATVAAGYWIKDNEPDPTKRRVPKEYLVPFSVLKAAAWPGSTVVTRHGHTLLVQTVHGRRVEGVLTTAGYPGYGQVGLVYADEIIAVHDDGETRSAA
jgi:hypothetical protein